LTILGIFTAFFQDQIKCQLGFRTDECPYSVQIQSARGTAAYPKIEQIANSLEKRMFREANERTIDFLKWAIEEKELDATTASDLPCVDLKTIDELWSKSSNGRFGFKAQQEIWNEVGQDPEKFSQRVGWVPENPQIPSPNLDYSSNAPQGHLPSYGFVGNEGVTVGDGRAFPMLYTTIPMYKPLAAVFDVGQCPKYD
jgi:hypothetical protein